MRFNAEDYSIPAGWKPLLQKCFDELEEYGVDEEFCFTQIKEKFGILRIGAAYYNKETEAIIDKYEERSMYTCSVCGNSKGTRLNVSGWLTVFCSECKRIYDEANS